MFAIFGIGFLEIVMIIGAGLLLVVPIVAVLVVVAATRKRD
jgi:hypothetical protein